MECRSLAPVINSKCTVLILGSMPGVESLAKQQYYAHPRNHFWPLLFTILKAKPFEEYRKKLELLLTNGIGLWDVLYQCERKGSLDSEIKNERPNDLEGFLHMYPNIKNIAFNGRKAHDSFMRHIGKENYHHISFHLMPSTSPVPSQNYKKLEDKLPVWQEVKNWIDKDICSES